MRGRGLRTCVRRYTPMEVNSNKVHVPPRKPSRSRTGRRVTPMATQTQTQRKATAQKAAATRRRNAAKRSQSAKKAAQTRAQAELNTLQVVQLQAERAALVPVGAALTARDAVVEAVKPYIAGRESAEKELEKVGKRVQVSLKRFERRGSTARNRALREVKRTRTRVERELRQRRSSAVRTVKQNRREAERQVKSTRRQFERQVTVARREVQGQADSIAQRVSSPGAPPPPNPAADLPPVARRERPGRDCRPHIHRQ